MVVSVHFADLGPRAVATLARGWRHPVSRPGLAAADLALAVPLCGSPITPRAGGRLGLIAFWSDDHGAERFREDHPLGRALKDGWHAVLEPLRITGSWPGLAPEVPHASPAASDDPVVGLTLTRVRPSRAVSFLRMSAPAQREALASPGLIWGTNLVDPGRRVAGTCSLWRSQDALTTYVHGSRRSSHRTAVAEDRRRPIFEQAAFLRLRVVRASGHLDGSVPLSWGTPS